MLTKNIFKLLSFSHKFSSIERSVKIKGRKTFETNAEHSFQLALLAWYVSDTLKIKLDRKKLLQYAIAHDLVETYAGDTDPHKHSKKFIRSKHSREQLAFKKIKKEFADFHDLHKEIADYELLRDDEAKLVYLLDKIVPIINTYLSKDSYYADNGVSFDKWRNWLAEKQARAAFRNPKFNDLIKEQTEFFSKINKGFFKK